MSLESRYEKKGKKWKLKVCYIRICVNVTNLYSENHSNIICCHFYHFEHLTFRDMEHLKKYYYLQFHSYNMAIPLHITHTHFPRINANFIDTHDIQCIISHIVLVSYSKNENKTWILKLSLLKLQLNAKLSQGFYH